MFFDVFTFIYKQQKFCDYFKSQSMTSPSDTLEGLNRNKKYNYVHVPKNKKDNSIRIDIARSNSENMQSNPDHQIKGTLSEMHILYLAIENYLRIQSKLSETVDVYRACDVLDDSYEKLYRVEARAVPASPPWSHLDNELGELAQGGDHASFENNQQLEETKKKIQKYFEESKAGVYGYMGSLGSGIWMLVGIRNLGNDIFRIQKKYIFNKIQIDARYTEADYTQRELMALRFALLDFLRYQLSVGYKFQVSRFTHAHKPVSIDSRISIHTTTPQLLIEI